jgi:hypothetical protein
MGVKKARAYRVNPDDPPRRALTLSVGDGSFFGMKLKTRRSVSLRAKARNERRAPRGLPKFSDAVKRVAGMIEGTPDLSSREGFGPTTLLR